MTVEIEAIRLSALIRKLQEFEAKHGDINVCIEDNGDHYPLGHIDLADEAPSFEALLCIGKYDEEIDDATMRRAYPIEVDCVDGSRTWYWDGEPVEGESS